MAEKQGHFNSLSFLQPGRRARPFLLTLFFTIWQWDKVILTLLLLCNMAVEQGHFVQHTIRTVEQGHLDPLSVLQYGSGVRSF